MRVCVRKNELPTCAYVFVNSLDYQRAIVQCCVSACCSEAIFVPSVRTDGKKRTCVSARTCQEGRSYSMGSR